jgi:hypothetical protein
MSGMGELMVYPGMLVLSDECTVIKSAWIREVDVVPVIEALEAKLKASEDFATTLTGTHPDDIHKSRDERIKELEKENFALAADQCHAGYGDDYGHHRCRLQDHIKELEELIHRADLRYDIDWEELKEAIKEKSPEKEADS